MKNILFAILLTSAATHFAFCQDTLYLTSGEKIEAMVSDVEVNVVKFKKYDNPQGPTYTFDKQQIAQIVYANGTKDVFVSAAAKEPPSTGDGEIQTNEPPSEEANFEINAGASYASEDFTDLKKAFADAAALETDLFVSNVGGNGNWKVTAGNAYSGYVSGFEKVLPFLSVGIKLSNLWSEEIKGEVTGEGNAGETFSYRTSIAPSLFSIAAGVKLQTRRRPHEVALSGSLLIGPAFANATLKGNGAFMDRVHGYSGAVEYSVPMSGTGFYAELGAALEYLFSESVGLTLGCGYHYCVVGQMHSNANVDTDRDGVTDIHANEKFTHINGSDVVFDFNGLDVSGGMKIIF